MVWTKKLNFGNRFKRKGPINWESHAVWLAKNAVMPERKPSRTIYNKRKGPLNWESHAVWLSKNAVPPIRKPSGTIYNRHRPVCWPSHIEWLRVRAKPRATKSQSSNTIGTYNPNTKITAKALAEQFARNTVPIRHKASAKSTKIRKFSARRFNKWYENTFMGRKIREPRIRRRKRPLKALLPKLEVIAKPIIRPEILCNLVPAPVSIKALTFKTKEIYDRLATPKKIPDPPIPKLLPRRRMTLHGWKRLEHIAKPRLRIPKFKDVIVRPEIEPISKKVLNYVITPRLDFISSPFERMKFIPLPPPLPDVNPKALKHRISPHLDSITKPKWITQKLEKRPEVPDIPEIPERVLKHNASPRTINLAISYKPREVKVKNRPIILEGLSKKVLCYRATPRIEKLATPRGPIPVIVKPKRRQKYELILAL